MRQIEQNKNLNTIAKVGVCHINKYLTLIQIFAAYQNKHAALISTIISI